MPETLEEENLRRREELQATRLRSEELRSELRKQRLTVRNVVEESRALRESRFPTSTDDGDQQ